MYFTKSFGIIHIDRLKHGAYFLREHLAMFFYLALLLAPLAHIHTISRII